MHVYARTPRYLYYQAEIQLSRPWQCRYFFRQQLEKQEPFYLFAENNGSEKRPFNYRWTKADIYATADWVKDAIFYQIFPDRFFNGNATNDLPSTRPWGEIPTRDNFFGGDLEGIQLKIPYLNFLGVNALWLNPIFASPSNHRYNTSDYLAVDPALGDKTVLRRLIESLHVVGMRLILDGVFNHTGTDFFAFKDIAARGPNSPYKDWYYIHGFPLKNGAAANYACWWDIPSLPKLNAGNPEVRSYLLAVATYWLRELGVDGWRLDVPNEIEPSFWQEFRRQVKETNPQAYIVGEIWHDARFWLQGKYFDAVMNYLFRDLILDCFARRRLSISALDFLLGVIRLRYPESINFSLLNLLGSHDTARIITAFQEELAAVAGHCGSNDEAVTHLQPALILQFTYPGAPMTYYGDEVGLTGGPDPDCRHTMPWNPQDWNQELMTLYRRLIALRRRLEPLRRGYFQPLFTDDAAGIYAYARRSAGRKVIIILNAGDFPQTVSLDSKELKLADGQIWLDGLSDRSFEVHQGKINLTVKENYGAILYQE